MSRPLRVLFTNITLASRTGTEVYVKEAALGLLRRGHTPLVYSPDLGEIAEEIRAASVPVVDDLSQLGAAPDVIHGHHHQQAMTALLHFPGVPGIFVTHDWMAWHDAPPVFPRIRRFLAIDWTNRDRVVFEHGIPEERVQVLPNWVDLGRFPPRGPLPERPRRALVFSNYARGDTHLPAVQEACRRAGLHLDVVGSGVGRSLRNPGEVIGEYDLVFAKAKSALEALAVGTAVVLCDYRGLGPMVTSAELDALRRLNLGLRTLRDPLVPDLILREIERYDSRDAAEVSRRVREGAGLEPALDRLVALYEEVIAEHERGRPWDPAEESRAAAVYLRDWAGWMHPLQALAADIDRQRAQLDLRVRELEEELRRAQNAQRAPEPEEDLQQTRLLQRAAELEAELQAARRERDGLAETLEASRRERDGLAEQLEAARRERDGLAETLQIAHRERDGLAELLQAVTRTITWRLREKVMRVPGLRTVYRNIRKPDRGGDQRT